MLLHNNDATEYSVCCNHNEQNRAIVLHYLLHAIHICGFNWFSLEHDFKRLWLNFIVLCYLAVIEEFGVQLAKH